MTRVGHLGTLARPERGSRAELLCQHSGAVGWGSQEGLSHEPDIHSLSKEQP